MSEYISSREKEGWVLTFEDTFQGTELDWSKWSYCPEEPRHTGFWSNQDAFLDGNGNLVMQISERDGKFYSGAIRTRDKFEQAFGYYEIRCQIPQEEGFWTAFWLYADCVQEVKGHGRDGTEIDIYESAYFKESSVQHALHWGGYEENHQKEEEVIHIPGIYEGFHVFALEWTKEEYIFFIDGKETWRTSAGGVCQVPLYVKVTAEVGPWAGDATQAKLPASWLVDYVRVYKREGR